ncbi:EamA family transporter RarD [Microbacterium sp. ARD32]|uniref:EamA family transporter RarD n=1 Tax=Microbacterium sp. ARD32 TaxID=2962577 RepID=UPI00288265C2|nr:EamA family transporter RarD [Microbacterium sp. ARD32]MDT0156429.1 EamA family transporter RarD [Microbacterium sp. ARD32]
MSTKSAGTLYTIGAYLLWGVFPLYFILLDPTGPFEVVAWRLLLTLVFCVVLLTLTRGWQRLREIWRRPRLLALTALAGLLIYVNWQVFVIATMGEAVVETSLGYFINPIFTVLLGVLVLHERIRAAQWVAIGIAAVAVGVIIVAHGTFPWIALTLTASFGLYGLVKKKIGPAVDAVSGLTLESFWMIPIAVVILVVVSGDGGITMGTVSPLHTALLSCAGIATAVPLLLFAAGTRRVDLSLVGMIQFITPIMQFLLGWAVLGEPMPPERWTGFILVWIAIAVFVGDLLVQKGRGRRAAPAQLV